MCVHRYTIYVHVGARSKSTKLMEYLKAWNLNTSRQCIFKTLALSNKVPYYTKPSTG